MRRNNIDEPIDEMHSSQDIKIVHQSHSTMHNLQKRIYVRDGGTLTISDIRRSDSGVYVCKATNSEGSETLEIKLTVIESLTAHIQPAQQIVDIGKSADLVNNK